MKKIIITLLFVAGSLGMFSANAQTKPAAKKAPAAAASSATPATKMKKDGTPDMRMKENKMAASKTTAPAGPMKKDGTPDMRYKANKKSK